MDVHKVAAFVDQACCLHLKAADEHLERPLVMPHELRKVVFKAGGGDGGGGGRGGKGRTGSTGSKGLDATTHRKGGRGKAGGKGGDGGSGGVGGAGGHGMPILVKLSAIDTDVALMMNHTQ